MKLSFPYIQNNVADILGQTNSFGVYPVNHYNTWHGGLHAEGDKEIRAIADGRIIAYRILEDYIKEKIDGKTYEYSSGFMLMQHEYKSPEGFTYPFYSLYHHLMSKNEMKGKIPDLYGKPIYKIKSAHHKKGIRVRGHEKLYDKFLMVIPKGHTVKVAKLTEEEQKKSHWSNTAKGKKYVKVSYTDPATKKTHTNLWMYRYKQDAKLKDGIYTIYKEIHTDKNSEQGAHVYDKPNGTFVRMINKDQEIKVEKTQGNWYKLKGKDEYVHKNDVSKYNEIKDDVVLNKVKNYDLAIKAGTLLGYTGKYNAERQPTYRTAHIEIFSHKNPEGLLNDEGKDGEKKKHYYKIAAGTSLKKNLKFDTTIKKNTPVKILAISGNYCKVEPQSVETTVQYKDLIDHKNKINSYGIKKGDAFATVNTAFNNILSNGDTLYFVKSDPEEKDKKWADKKNRIVRFDPKAKGKSIWIDLDATKQEALQPIASIKPRSFVIDGVKEDLAGTTTETTTETETATEPELITPRVTETVRLRTDVSEYYLIQPIEDETEEVTLSQEHLLLIRKTKHVTNPKDKKWCYIICKEEQEEKKGWIAQDDAQLEQVSAFDWTIFGFEPLEAGNEFVYSVAEIRNATSTTPFIETIWGKVDANQDKVLDHNEWRTAYRKIDNVTKFSKLVCKHKSEWAYTSGEIERETKQFFDIQDVDAAKKQEKINALKERIKNLCFWKELKAGEFKEEPKDDTAEVMGPMPPKPLASPASLLEAPAKPRMIPPNPEVWHFHPISFINHMKKITNPYDPDHGEWYDPIVNPQVRGHYIGQLGIHSEHKGWDTDRSRAIKRRLRNGKPRMHHGLDIYAPVGTPIYACQDFTKVTRHRFRERKAGGFDLNFNIKYKDKTHVVVYCHMIEFLDKKFCLGGVMGKSEEYHTYESCINTKKIQLKHTNGSLEKNAIFEVTYAPAANTLTIDKMVVDLDIAKKNYEGVSKDDLPKKGDIVGYVGMTGNAVQHRNTAHLHLAMYDATEKDPVTKKIKELEPAQILKEYIINDEEGDSMSKQDGYIPSSEW
ncbi:M23 family metallopeptidase [Aquimarina algicola]|uniref:M23 family metallopeptidase n=1 Tax=Aquimarina algicola TaxID=2589995 RepID=A0A504JBD3_9FLAO|nr:M23 family metallopeptidase [Aquimarina algicola]TPN85855.1 M23 family metallopeptidase [Aquimarina algicola]